MKDFNLVFSAVRTGRSLAASYSLQNDIQREYPIDPLIRSRLYNRCSSLVFIQVQSDQEAKLFESQASTTVTLIKGCKSLKIVKDINDVPAGCGSELLTPTVVIHVLVRVSTRPSALSAPLEHSQGLIDFDVEIAKCEKKLNLARLNLEKIRKVESQPDYEEAVPENVRLINGDKVWPNNYLLSYGF